MEVLAKWMLFASIFDTLKRGRGEDAKGTRKTTFALMTEVQRIARDITENFLYLSEPKNGQPPVVDLVFALDASSSSSMDVFDYERKLVAALLDGFSISPSGTRVSIVSCSLVYCYVNFDFKKHVNKNCVMTWLPIILCHMNLFDCRHQGGYPALGNCLKTINTIVFKKGTGMRINSRKILFVISISKTWVGMFPKFPASWLKKNGVEIFGLAIGPKKDALDQLRQLASVPIDKHVFWVKMLDDIRPLVNMLWRKGGFPTTCHGNGTHYDECERRCSCIRGQLTQCERVRENFRSMSKQNRIRFIKALQLVSTKEPFKSEYVTLVFNYKHLFHCVNERKFFLPWHRAFLLYLENLLRQVDCRITIPYLDWSNDAYAVSDKGAAHDQCVLTQPFRKDEWIINKNICLKRPFQGNAPDAKTLEVVFDLPWQKFSDFELIMRVIFHHSISCDNIGGNICSQEAAKTLEFIMLTAYVDKLWGRWQNLSNFHRDTGFPHVSDKLPGFYRRYVGEMKRLDKQPGCVKIVYDKSAEIEDDKTTQLSKGWLTHYRVSRKTIQVFAVSKEEKRHLLELQRRLILTKDPNSKGKN